MLCTMCMFGVNKKLTWTCDVCGETSCRHIFVCKCGRKKHDAEGARDTAAKAQGK